MHDTYAARTPFEPQVQRYRDYARQRQMTLSDLLLENRIVFLGASPEVQFPQINDLSASLVIQKLLFLQYENKNQEINMYINCPGGSVTATLAIYDTMQFLECPISTYCMGLAASGAAIILVAGGKGKRFALPHSKIMVHQPYGQVAISTDHQVRDQRDRGGAENQNEERGRNIG